MRFREIIVEYNRSKTAQQMGGSIAQAAAKETQLSDLEPQEQINQVLEKAEAADPTPNKKYVLWIVRQFVKNGLKYGDINEILKQNIEQFHDLPQKRKQQMKIETDINRYTWRDLRELSANLKKSTDLEEPVDAKLDYEHIDDMKVLYVGDMGKLIVPTTEAASCEIGKGTQWCTGGDVGGDAFNDYAKKGPLYVWIPSRKMPEKTTSNKYQFHFPTKQFMDEKDEDIEEGLLWFFRSAHPILKKLFPKQEENLDATDAYRFVQDYIDDRYPPLEDVIIQDGLVAAEYARAYLEEWPEAEETIKQDPAGALIYATEVLDKRWPEAEETIKQDEGAWQEYKEWFEIE